MSAHDRKKQQRLAAKKARRAVVRAAHLGEKAVLRAAASRVTLQGVRHAMAKNSLGIVGAGVGAGQDATDSLLNMDLAAVADSLGVAEVAESVSESGEVYGSEPPAV